MLTRKLFQLVLTNLKESWKGYIDFMELGKMQFSLIKAAIKGRVRVA